MNHRIIKTMLITVALLVCAGLSFAETKAPAKTPADQQKAAVKSAKAKKAKAAAKVKLVDINSAGKTELMKLPNINAALADKIIAGRPYGSKAHLMTRNIMPEGIYEGVKALVIAKQPFASTAKNAEVFDKAKKK